MATRAKRRRVALSSAADAEVCDLRRERRPSSELRPSKTSFRDGNQAGSSPAQIGSAVWVMTARTSGRAHPIPTAGLRPRNLVRRQERIYATGMAPRAARPDERDRPRVGQLFHAVPIRQAEDQDVAARTVAEILLESRRGPRPTCPSLTSRARATMPISGARSSRKCG